MLSTDGVGGGRWRCDLRFHHGSSAKLGRNLPKVKSVQLDLQFCLMYRGRWRVACTCVRCAFGPTFLWPTDQPLASRFSTQAGCRLTFEKAGRHVAIPAAATSASDWPFFATQKACHIISASISNPSGTKLHEGRAGRQSSWRKSRTPLL